MSRLGSDGASLLGNVYLWETGLGCRHREEVTAAGGAGCRRCLGLWATVKEEPKVSFEASGHL